MMVSRQGKRKKKERTKTREAFIIHTASKRTHSHLVALALR